MASGGGAGEALEGLQFNQFKKGTRGKRGRRPLPKEGGEGEKTKTPTPRTPVAAKCGSNNRAVRLSSKDPAAPKPKGSLKISLSGDPETVEDLLWDV